MENLPLDNLVEILKEKSPEELANFMAINRYFNNLSKNPIFWQKLINITFGYRNVFPTNLATYRLFYDLERPIIPLNDILDGFKKIELEAGLEDIQAAITEDSNVNLLNWDYWMVIPPDPPHNGLFILAYTLFGAIYKLQRYFLEIGRQDNLIAGLLQYFKRHLKISLESLDFDSIVALTKQAYQREDLYLLEEVPEFRKYTDLKMFEYDSRDNYSEVNGVIRLYFSEEPAENLPNQYYLLRPKSSIIQIGPFFDLSIIGNHIISAKTFGQALLAANKLFYQRTGRSFLNELYNFIKSNTKLNNQQTSDEVLRILESEDNFYNFYNLTFY